MYYTILDYHTNRRYVPAIYKLQNITKPIQRFHICLAVLTCCCVVALFVSFCSIDCLSVFRSLLLFMFGFVIPPDLLPLVFSLILAVCCVLYDDEDSSSCYACLGLKKRKKNAFRCLKNCSYVISDFFP